MQLLKFYSLCTVRELQTHTQKLLYLQICLKNLISLGGNIFCFLFPIFVFPNFANSIFLYFICHNLGSYSIHLYLLSIPIYDCIKLFTSKPLHGIGEMKANLKMITKGFFLFFLNVLEPKMLFFSSHTAPLRAFLTNW